MSDGKDAVQDVTQAPGAAQGAKTIPFPPETLTVEHIIVDIRAMLCAVLALELVARNISRAELRRFCGDHAARHVLAVAREIGAVRHARQTLQTLADNQPPAADDPTGQPDPFDVY